MARHEKPAFDCTINLIIIFLCSYHDRLFSNLMNSLYLVAITFLSVGYGDFVPHTYCGRSISVLSGLMVSPCNTSVYQQLRIFTPAMFKHPLCSTELNKILSPYVET